jgi:hypothetical protein
MKRDSGEAILFRSVGTIGSVNEQQGALHDEILSLLVVMMQRSDLMTRSLTLSAENQHKQRASLVLSRNDAGIMRCRSRSWARAAQRGALAAARASKVSMMRMRLPQQGQGCSARSAKRTYVLA